MTEHDVLFHQGWLPGRDGDRLLGLACQFVDAAQNAAVDVGQVEQALPLRPDLLDAGFRVEVLQVAVCISCRAYQI